jgi:hypothetical protein
MNLVDHSLPYFRQQLITHLCQPICLFRLCLLKVHRVQLLAPHCLSGAVVCQQSTFPGFVYWKFSQRSPPCLSPLLLCAECTLLPLLHVIFSSLFIIQCFWFFVFFLWGGSQSIQGAMLVYPRDSCGNTMCHSFAHLLVCVSQADLETESGGAGALLFSQCNVAWRSFVLAGGSECQSFASSWWNFFLRNVVPSSEQNFWFTELMLSASPL